MPKALVFISTVKDTPELVSYLEKVEGVSEAHSSLGLYNAIAMVEGESFTKVKETVFRQIRSLDNVKSTLTLTLMEAPL